MRRAGLRRRASASGQLNYSSQRGPKYLLTPSAINSTARRSLRREITWSNNPLGITEHIYRQWRRNLTLIPYILSLRLQPANDYNTHPSEATRADQPTNQCRPRIDRIEDATVSFCTIEVLRTSTTRPLNGLAGLLHSCRGKSSPDIHRRRFWPCY